MSREATLSERAAFAEVLDEENGEKTSQAALLVKFVVSRCELFHDSNGDAYARIRLGGEVHRLESRSFRDWMLCGFYAAEGKPARDQAVREALATLSGIARYQGEQRDVYIRTAYHEGAHFIDLGHANDSRAVRVAAEEWEVVQSPPTMFVRTESTRPLPVPVPGGDISRLFEFTNVPEDHRLLVIVWLIDSLRSNGPYALLELSGEPGACKSMTTRVLRRLIDPSGCELRSAPRSTEDLFVATASSHVIALENISHLPATMQDCLCTLSTGTGYARRRLYSNNDEVVVVAKRPVIVNGVNACITAPDLIDRSISIELQPIAERIESDVLVERFDREHSVLFGALLDIFAGALARLPQVRLPADQRPRLIEFAKLGFAVAETMGRPGMDFLKEFNSSRADSTHRALDASPAAAALVEMFEAGGRQKIELPLKELLDRLDRFRPAGAEAWPRSARGLGDVLRRAAPALRQIGIDVRRVGKSTGNIIWRVTSRRNQQDQHPQRPQHPSPGAGPGMSGTLGTSTQPISTEEIVL